MMQKLRDETPPSQPETGDKEIDEDFFKKYKKLRNMREFTNREESFSMHTYNQKLIVLNRVDKSLHLNLEPRSFFGVGHNKKNSLYEQMSSPRDSDQQYKPLPNLRSKRAEVNAQKKRKRNLMVNSYRDRLLPRFAV